MIKLKTKKVDKMPTTPLQINGNWTGIYIEGQEAMYGAAVIGWALEQIETYEDKNKTSIIDFQYKHELSDLANTLSSCNEYAMKKEKRKCMKSKG